MTQRILDVGRCPHCGGDLARPTPRLCPSCGGSLQQRYHSWGCLTSAPKLLALGAGAWTVVELARALAAR